MACSFHRHDRSLARAEMSDDEESDASTPLIVSSHENRVGSKDERTSTRKETAPKRLRRAHFLICLGALVAVLMAVAAVVLGLELSGGGGSNTDYISRANALLADYPVIDGSAEKYAVQFTITAS